MILLLLILLEITRAKENVIAEELIAEITPKGRGNHILMFLYLLYLNSYLIFLLLEAQVPEKVKQEMLAKIKVFLATYASQPQS